MIAFTLDLSRINKSRIFVGKTGKKYLSFVLIDSPDHYGNAGQVVASIPKEERLAGGKREIVGSWKILGGSKPQARAPTQKRLMPPCSGNIFDSPAEAFAAAAKQAAATKPAADPDSETLPF